MDEVRLSAHERRALAGMEAALSRDRALDRRLSSMRRGLLPRVRPLPRMHGRLSLGVIVLLAASVALMVPAIETGSPVLTWLFAGLWALTLIGLTVLVVRWCRRWARHTGA